MRAWYVAKTKPLRERQAATMLGQRGLEAYLPLIVGKGARRDLRRAEALFPGYLFARLDAQSSEWVEARSAPGIVYFLGAGLGIRLVPTPVPDSLVAEIRGRLARQEYERRAPRFRGGERVRIADGPFAGLEAVFDGTLSAAGRSRVLVWLVGRLVPVQLDLRQLQALAG